jgi:hypothetical protein
MLYKTNPDRMGILVFMFFLIAGGLKFGFETLQAAQTHEPQEQHQIMDR